MITVHKFPLVIMDKQMVAMPEGAEILCVQIQHGQPNLWARVDTDNPMRIRSILIHGTGHECNPDAKYIGTFQMVGGGFIGHVFEE